jgi:DNA-binding transcriptional LysR family regulator
MFHRVQYSRVTLNSIELREVDLNLLVVLDALLEEASVTRAAGRLEMSTPAVSHALARLRDHFRDPILVRSGRGMVRSSRAVELRPRVRALVAEIGEVLRPAGDIDPASIERRFRLRATDHVLLILGTNLDALTRREAPGAILEFLPNRPDDGEALRAGEIDLAIGVYPQLPPELRIRKLFDDRFVCVVRRGHPIGERRLTPRRYAALEHVLVAPRGRPGGTFDRLLAERGLERRVTRAVPYFVAAFHLVSRSDCVLTVSERLARSLAGRFALRVLEPPLDHPGYTLRMIWHPGREGDSAHRWLRSTVVRAAELTP